MTIQRQKSRLRLALCLTTLPIIINTKVSSSFNTFPEGVSFDTDSFLIAIDSGWAVLYFTAHEANEPKVYQEDLILKELVLDAIASKATSNLNTLYLLEDMLAPYDAQYWEAMKEVNKHTRKGHCRVIMQSDVPCHSEVMLMLWMKRQRRIEMREVSKPKARLNLWGHIGVHSCQETHAIAI
jgi:hypothetical protein